MMRAAMTPKMVPAGTPDPPRERPRVDLEMSGPSWPRLLSRKLAAAYLSVSTSEIDRLITIGAIAIVRLPAVRHQNGAATSGANRRILIDRLELDELCVRNRERR